MFDLQPHLIQRAPGVSDEVGPIRHANWGDADNLFHDSQGRNVAARIADQERRAIGAMAFAGVVDTVCRDAADLFILGDLLEQVGQNRSIADVASRDLDGAMSTSLKIRQ